MLKSLIISVASLLIIGVMGCSGQGGNRIPGKQCKRDEKLFPTRGERDTNNGKLLETEIAQNELPAGNYIYQSGSIYYVDSAIYQGPEGEPRNYRIKVNEERASDGTYSAAVDCVRYAKPEMAPISLSAPVTSQLKVGSDKSTEMPTAPFGFVRTADGKIEIFSTQKPRQKPGEKLTEGTPTEQWFIKVDDNTYEIHATGTSEKGTFYSRVKMVLDDASKKPKK